MSPEPSQSNGAAQGGSEVAVPSQGEIIVLVSLDELAATANREHEFVEEHARSTLVHLVRAGSALLEAKERCEHGQWQPWLRANFASSQWTANFYMRVAIFGDEIQEELESPTHGSILAWLRKRGTRADGGAPREIPPSHVRDEIVRLHEEEGWSQHKIANALGVGRTTVRRYLRPEYREQIERRASGPPPVGPAVLADRFRAVAEANKQGELGALRSALEGLAEVAERWAVQLDQREDSNVA